MTDLAVIYTQIPSMSTTSISKVRELEAHALNSPQIDIGTNHVIHAGVYARTIVIPAGCMITGALIKIATLLIVQGDIIMYIGGESIELTGYNVIPASANRKQAFLAKTETHMTMLFPSNAKSIQDAEMEFTDEIDMLISNKNSSNNTIVITGA